MAIGQPTLVIVFAASIALAGCSGGDSSSSPSEAPEVIATESFATEAPEAASPAFEVALTPGEMIMIFGTNAESRVTAESPAEATVTSVECAPQFDEVGVGDSGEPVPIVANTGQQLCLIEMSVTNVGSRPTAATSSGEVELLASNSRAYTEVSGFSAGTMANLRGHAYSGDVLEMNPDTTEYDYLMFEIPADATPVKLVYVTNRQLSAMQDWQAMNGGMNSGVN